MTRREKELFYDENKYTLEVVGDDINFINDKHQNKEVYGINKEDWNLATKRNKNGTKH